MCTEQTHDTKRKKELAQKSIESIDCRELIVSNSVIRMNGAEERISITMLFAFVLFFFLLLFIYFQSSVRSDAPLSLGIREVGPLPETRYGGAASHNFQR